MPLNEPSIPKWPIAAALVAAILFVLAVGAVLGRLADVVLRAAGYGH